MYLGAPVLGSSPAKVHEPQWGGRAGVPMLWGRYLIVSGLRASKGTTGNSYYQDEETRDAGFVNVNLGNVPGPLSSGPWVIQGPGVLTSCSTIFQGRGFNWGPSDLKD